jgi:predicted porin
MKKTLIALAAVAVSSAAMAQVTISGTIAAGYANDTTKAGVKTSGYGFDTTSFTMSASEDLGNGLKASGSMAFENAGEDVATNGNGATLGLSGGFGSVVFSSVETGDFLPVDGLTASSAGTDADRITYTSPKIAGFTASVAHQDAIDEGKPAGAVDTAKSGFAPVNPLEIDADARGTSSVLTIGVNYTNGPISADIVSADFRGAAKGKDRLGVRGSYDFGVAKVTYGQMKETNTDTTKNVTETGLTIAAPLGPVTAAYSMVTSKTGTAAKRKGNSLSVSYALSKRSSIAFYNEAHDTADGTGTSKVKEQSLLLVHKF